MIRLQWTARISRGKNQAAIQWAKATAEHLKSKYPQILAAAAYEEHFGNVNTIHIFSDYDSLATLEAVEAQYPSDAAFQDLMYKSNEAGLFIEGSIHGTLVKSLKELGAEAGGSTMESDDAQKSARDMKTRRPTPAPRQRHPHRQLWLHLAVLQTVCNL